MTEKMIIDAYCRIRTIDNTIPDDVLDFMKDAAIEKLRIANAVICSACGSENSIRWEKKEISIDDKQGSYKDLTFDFCEECGNVTNVDLS
jgi:hypothetical protein